jgi:hypothetical protein
LLFRLRGQLTCDQPHPALQDGAAEAGGRGSELQLGCDRYWTGLAFRDT